MNDLEQLQNRVRVHLLKYGGLASYVMPNLKLIKEAPTDRLHKALNEWTEPTIIAALAPCATAYTKETNDV